MPLPIITFNTFDELETYVNTVIIPNAMQLIDGEEHNAVENGLLEFIRKSPLNWETGNIVSSGGAVSATRPVTVITTTTPTTLSWSDNIYNEYIFVNMTGNAIPLLSPLVYFTAAGTSLNYIPENTAVTILKTTNGLWVATSVSGTGGGGGSTQKQPRTFVVGTTLNAPTAGTFTWTLPAFANSWVVLILARSIIVDMEDTGDGSAYITKAVASDTLTISNYGEGWNTGDILSYILITP